MLSYCLPRFAPHLYHRRAVDGDFVAELADFLVADDEDGFVVPQLGFAGDEQGAVVHIGRHGVARQEFEFAIAVAPGIEQEETEGTEILSPLPLFAPVKSVWRAIIGLPLSRPELNRRKRREQRFFLRCLCLLLLNLSGVRS